ncbi:hypothetical protein HanIR_Chr15g0770091 [Helianthus annuus]|nr:hypothetical protein HanIR_Chr15g0770091 [Helianthus annuus]
MGSNKNGMLVQFSKLTRSEIDKFCLDHGIDPSLETNVPGERTVNKCLEGFLVFYTRILDQPNLRYPFTNFFLESLKYYCLSLGQLAPVGVARIIYFEILCRALSYEPSLMFRRFFHLSRNGDWYTIEKTQCEIALLSTTVGHTYAWKNQFFFISSWLLPFTVVPRKFSEGLNEKESEVHELEQRLLLKLRISRTKLRAYPEELLVVLEMGALDYILLDDPSCVEIEQREIPEGGPSIFCRTEHVRTAGDVESIPLQPIMDGSSAKKLHAPVRRSTKGTISTSAISQSSDPISTNSGDGDDASVVASVTRIKLVKKEVVSEAYGGAGDASSHSDLNQSFVLI